MFFRNSFLTKWRTQQDVSLLHHQNLSSLQEAGIFLRYQRIRKTKLQLDRYFWWWNNLELKKFFFVSLQGATHSLPWKYYCYLSNSKSRPKRPVLLQHEKEYFQWDLCFPQRRRALVWIGKISNLRFCHYYWDRQNAGWWPGNIRERNTAAFKEGKSLPKIRIKVKFSSRICWLWERGYCFFPEVKH